MSLLGSRLFRSLGTTIFAKMSALATETGAINLGQGFPDEDGPATLRARAAQAILTESNQYPPSPGLPALRQAIARHAERHYGLNFDWTREVIVTSGGTEATGACLMALLNPGDEAVLIEPAYDCYRPIIEAIGAVPKGVALRPPAFELPMSALAAAVNARTRVIVLNSPMNPAGKVFSQAELEGIADLARKRNLLVVCDEVYEHLTFDGAPHIPLITLPGMRERCLRVGSAGKIFSLTGWKVGWITGDASLVQLAAKAHQFITFTTPPALQMAVAEGLEKEEGYYLSLKNEMAAKRDILAAGLTRVGFDVLPCQGTYFITANAWPLDAAVEDESFCERMTREAGVAAIPLSAFYIKNAPRNLVRFAFCKRPEVLEDAIQRLKGYFGR
ncbi:MAG: aminotransferase [Alphaproteobacteria bacterium]|nr:aminotransferase [Alphaproteobacteria bacterium]